MQLRQALMPRTNAQRRYDAKNIKTFSFMVNRKTEPELLSHLQDMPNRATYIKRLIREDMERQGIKPHSGPTS